MKQVQILGTGRYAPENIVKNEDLCKVVETSDDWITSRTGIKERRISSGENTSDLATKAAIRAMEEANIKPEEIDLIILGTITPDAFTPSTACIVQSNIGAVNATCFDINAACSGFIYAMNIATQFIKTSQSKTALVIGVEVLSKVLDWTDRNTCVLFGDGAGAAILRESDEVGIISIYTGSDGKKGQCLSVPALSVRNILVQEDIKPSVVKMDGKEVFRFATKVIVESIEKVLQNTGYGIEDIKYIIPHQANLRIIDYAAKKLNLDPSRFYVNLDRFGNTSAGSIGIALDEMSEKGVLQKGDRVIAVGFGGGLTWGAVLFQWTKE